MPFSHAFEGAEAAILELDSRPRDEILDGAGDEYLVRLGLGRNPCVDVDHDSAYLAVDELALAGVQPGSDLDAELGHRVAIAPTVAPLLPLPATTWIWVRLHWRYPPARPP